MTIKEFLHTKTKQLEAVGIATARLDCLVLLEEVLHTDRTQLLAHDDQTLTVEQLTLLDQAVDRRAKHEPLAYIRGKSEFYGRVFNVTPATLEPRPETETMVSLLLNWLASNEKLTDKKPLRLIDVGTGSGAIAITIKLEKPELEVIGTELNPETLEIAKKNAKLLDADVTFILSNLLTPPDDSSLVVNSDKSTILLCNLPYVPDSYTINQAAMQEPEMAIFGGVDGLDLYRELFKQVDTLPAKPVTIFTESLPFQHHGLATIARQYGYVQDRKDDFIQLFEYAPN